MEQSAWAKRLKVTKVDMNCQASSVWRKELGTVLQKE